jgi:hypothetical protein
MTLERFNVNPPSAAIDLRLPFCCTEQRSRALQSTLHAKVVPFLIRSLDVCLCYQERGSSFGDVIIASSTSEDLRRNTADTADGRQKSAHQHHQKPASSTPITAPI